MATFHVSVKTFSRSKNHSAVAAAAYRGAMLLVDTRTNQQYDYRGRKGVLQVRCFVPRGAPSWADDPQTLWGAAEEAEKRKDSTVCRNFEVSLPHELDDQARWDLVSELATRLVDRYGFVIQASSHAPTIHSDPRHFYAHLLATTRRLGPDGFGGKTRELDGVVNGRTEVEGIRAMIGQEILAHLTRAQASAPAPHHTLPKHPAAQRVPVTNIDGQGDLSASSGAAAKSTELTLR